MTDKPDLSVLVKLLAITRKKPKPHGTKAAKSVLDLTPTNVPVDGQIASFLLKDAARTLPRDLARLALDLAEHLERQDAVGLASLLAACFVAGSNTKRRYFNRKGR